ncbi:AbaSI family restriction endonuclease [Vibrio sp. V12_P9A6T4]|uniref:AbaSI family restriction endonuclease n=1 Tax=Vibrio sp. V12_P9A6T4 TaxID=1938667 RepID=UPI0030DD8FEB
MNQSRLLRRRIFTITRIIHALPDDVEFITQQLVRLPDGNRALTDLFFPQFNIHLEIDEPHHKNQKVKDLKREQDIIKRTEHSVERIQIASDKVERTLESIKSDTDSFIEKILALRCNKLSQGSFVPWDFEHGYSSIPVINLGKVAINDNVVFQKQIEALRCFGFKGNGYQRGAWQIPDSSKDLVWFPRLYEHGIWHNELTSDGMKIIERALDNNEEAIESIKKQKERQISGKCNKSIVFARAKNSLGFNLYRYVGTFLMNLEESTDSEIIFDRVSEEEKVRVD